VPKPAASLPVRKRPSSAASSAPPSKPKSLLTHDGSNPLPLRRGRCAICRIEEKGAAGESDTEAISAELADDDAAKALAVALAHVVAHEPCGR
jgi:hypothetical protein